MARDVRVTVAGLAVPDPPDEPVDVLFDGHRVWSFHPVRDATGTGRNRIVCWPAALTPYLDGICYVALVTHADGRSLFGEEVSFGESTDRILLVDAEDNPLSVDKGGRMQREFTHVDADLRGHIIDAVERVLHDLTEECGLEAYLAYGCLLGAVRSGHMIGHDSDADVAYLSRHTHPFDIVRESREASRRMRRLGWQVMRMSGANFKVWLPLPDGRRCGIDVFGSFVIGEKFHIMGSLRGTLDRSAVLPLGTVTLEGRSLAAPAKPEEFLAFTYGPGWQTPDPAFKFGHHPDDVRRMDAWFRATRRRLRFWHDFYRSPAVSRVPKEPSSFATWVGERVGPRAKIVDLGTGNGRDAVWFASTGRGVTALDFVPAGPAVRKLARSQGARVRFDHLNMENLRTTLTTGARLAHQPGIRHVYARGMLDTLAPSGRQNLWRFASMLQRRGGRTFLEFRTTTSRNERAYFGDHLRTYLDPDDVVREIEERGGTVVERLVGRDLAPLGPENPEICRLVVRWKQ